MASRVQPTETLNTVVEVIGSGVDTPEPRPRLAHTLSQALPSPEPLLTAAVPGPPGVTSAVHSGAECVSSAVEAVGSGARRASLDIRKKGSLDQVVQQRISRLAASRARSPGTT